VIAIPAATLGYFAFLALWRWLGLRLPYSAGPAAEPERAEDDG
jgi:hypothetical protein